MKFPKTLSYIFFILAGITCSFLVAHGALVIPGENILQGPSIPINSTPGDGVSQLQSFGFRVLGFLKLFISGIALIYLVLIGAYMIVYSETEDKVKAQRKQITYALIGFLFLNIPGALYTVFLPSAKDGAQITSNPNYSDITSPVLFWDTFGFEGVFGGLIAFFRVFIFGVAIVMFTWGIFRMITSAGNEEAQKQGKNRLIYGTIALIFLGFVELWGRLVAEGDFENYIPFIANRLFGIAIFFAAPVAIFFLIWGAYYYITSAGDEERIKKGKNILINTFIATLILIAGLSFLSDIIKFTL